MILIINILNSRLKYSIWKNGYFKKLTWVQTDK